MDSRAFVHGVKQELIDKGYLTYVHMYENPAKASEETDFFKALQEDQKHTFFRIIRHVQVDMVASFLSLLDGHFLLAGQTSDYCLTTEANRDQKLNVDLFDDFLELVDADTKG